MASQLTQACRSALLALCGVALMGFTSSEDNAITPLPAAGQMDVIEIPVRSNDCWECIQGCNGFPEQHEMERNPTVVLGWTGSTHPCVLGTCTWDHSPEICWWPLGEVEQKEVVNELREAIYKHDAVALEALLREYGEVATYSADRNAVQVRGCTESLIAHLPVTEDVAVSLEE